MIYPRGVKDQLCNPRYEWDEVGACGMASIEQIRSIIPKEDLWPIDGDAGSPRAPPWHWHAAFGVQRNDSWLSPTSYRWLFRRARGPNGTLPLPMESLHDELEALVEAGLSPADAVRAATLGAAEFSGVAERFGSVSTGKVADLLLLDGNPLKDVGQTRAIHALFLNGRHFDRAALDSLLAYAESRAGSPAQNLKTLWAGARSPLLRLQFAD